MKIGVMIRLAEDVAAGDVADGRCPSYGEIRDAALFAEDAGFDSVWLADHLLYRRPGQATMGIWESWTMLSALAEATSRVEIGTMTLCAAFRNPAVLAKMAVTVDEVSRGRLILGIGAGWNEPEYRAFGLPFERRVDRFEEALQIIVPLLRTGHVTFTGKYYSVEDCELTPRGPRSDGPPLLIGAAGPRMLRLAARYADIWNATDYLAKAEAFAPHRDAFEAARAETGSRKVGLSAMAKVGWSDIGALPGFFGQEWMTGSAEDLAAGFKAWSDAGVAHLICQYHPNRAETLRRLSDGLRAYRGAA
jgi:alkanesulfonate monooxygenase SsuD/methylene tetrahydromethanopterin reductase-like flavin-dependent oxidoreductase (luciferase family)